ncbi:protein FAM200A-like [Homarus americanus]|uniref:protein FAM200A-like n=1 Tax=Homarus americanus TaxID=6706 RepID=UPI001C49645D|nr:protein FAM200A-like [Homarus americanus]
MPQDQRLRPIGTWPDTVTDPGQETGRNLCSCRRLWIIFSLTSLILSIMDRFLKTSSESATKKRKRSINPSFLDKYGVADVSGKGICVMCSKELAEESLKPNKLQRHMETHTNVACLAADLKEQILEDFKNSPWIALAVDESTDITSQPQLLIFGRFLKESSVAEELLACISLETTTRGEDIFSAIDKFFTENNLECSMEGAPSMMGKNIGLRGILSRKHPHIKTNHCIIHRQSLASKDMSQSFSDVMQVGIATVNYVKAKDLNSRMFKQLCIAENCNHHTPLMHTAVRWLSRGKTLERVFLLRSELASLL